MKNKEKQTNNGITLIALVITIIILLILAGVSIIILTGENGILTNATEAKEETEITDMNANFTMKGAIGYLYAEQELNEICKIYGYGYGADTSQITEYDYGGPLDGELTGKITDSGARSITVEDINKIAGITEEDYGKLNSSYGSTIDFTTPIYYPTVKTTAGRSNSAGVKNLEYTSYSYLKSEIENMNIQNMLFNGSYWIASRCISINSFGGFGIRNVKEDTMYAYFICNGMPFDLDEISSTNFAIRPVVTLKSNVIDTSSSTEYNGETMWNLK